MAQLPNKGPEDIELGQRCFDKLEEAIEQDGGFSGIQFLAPKMSDKTELGLKNKIALDSLAKVIDTLPDYDFSLDPSATVVNSSLLSSGLKREVRQLKIINEELIDNNRQEVDQESSQRDGMDNTEKMLKGLKTAVDGAWDEDLDEEYKKVKKMKKRLNKALHTILDNCFPDDREELKNIFEVLNEKRIAGDTKFFKIPKDWSHHLVEFLLSAFILQRDDADPTMVKSAIVL